MSSELQPDVRSWLPEAKPDRESAINALIAVLRACDPQNFNMGIWHEKQACRTVGCLAGWTYETFKPLLHPHELPGLSWIPYAMLIVGRDMLRLTNDEAHLLFTMDLGHKTYEIRDADNRAFVIDEAEDLDDLPADFRLAAGIRVLEILRDTGYVNWPLALVDTVVARPGWTMTAVGNNQDEGE